MRGNLPGGWGRRKKIFPLQKNYKQIKIILCLVTGPLYFSSFERKGLLWKLWLKRELHQHQHLLWKLLRKRKLLRKGLHQHQHRTAFMGFQRSGTSRGHGSGWCWAAWPRGRGSIRPTLLYASFFPFLGPGPMGPWAQDRAHGPRTGPMGPGPGPMGPGPGPWAQDRAHGPRARAHGPQPMDPGHRVHWPWTVGMWTFGS